MAIVNDILKNKAGQPVHTVDRGETVLSATHRMNEHSIGALIVTENGQMCGIFTERDVLRRVVVEQRDPTQSRVGEVMTAHLACCSPDTTIDDVRSIMRTHRVRHLPVVGAQGELLGMISIGDLNAFLANDREVTIHFLNEYLHGRT